MEHWRLVLEIINFIITWTVAYFVFLDRRRKENDHRFTQIGKRLEEGELRMGTLETNVSHPACTLDKVMIERISASTAAFNSRINDLRGDLDGKFTKSIHALDVRLDSLHGDIRELTGTVRGLNRAVDLMNEYLINKTKG